MDGVAAVAANAITKLARRGAYLWAAFAIQVTGALTGSDRHKPPIVELEQPKGPPDRRIVFLHPPPPAAA